MIILIDNFIWLKGNLIIFLDSCHSGTTSFTGGEIFEVILSHLNEKSSFYKNAYF